MADDGLRERDLGDGRCALHGGPLNEGGHPMFYRVRIERFCFRPDAIHRRLGLEQYFAGGPATGGGRWSAVLAQVMGADEDLARRLGEPRTILVCQQCALAIDAAPIGVMLERADAKAEGEGG